MSDKLSIDEQLAEENRKFDARLAADAKAERKAEGQKLIPKVTKVRVPPKRKVFRAGEVAHPHFRETDEGMLEIPCLYVDYTVKDRKGFTINDRLYKGKVVVAQCTANVLSEMENKHRAMERGIFEDRGRQLHYGEIRG
jgi:hypothetical protein